MYTTFISPHINYGIIIWSFQLDKISLAQKKVIRSVTCSKYLTHSEHILKNVQLLKVEDILKANNLTIFITKYNVNSNLPEYVCISSSREDNIVITLGEK